MLIRAQSDSFTFVQPSPKCKSFLFTIIKDEETQQISTLKNLELANCGIQVYHSLLPWHCSPKFPKLMKHKQYLCSFQSSKKRQKNLFVLTNFGKQCPGQEQKGRKHVVQSKYSLIKKLFNSGNTVAFTVVSSIQSILAIKLCTGIISKKRFILRDWEIGLRVKNTASCTNFKRPVLGTQKDDSRKRRRKIQ